MRHRTFVAALVLAFGAGGCGMRPLKSDADIVPLPPPPVTDRALEDRILALDPSHVTPADVRDVLAKGPTPS